jgi:hypothetical protein
MSLVDKIGCLFDSTEILAVEFDVYALTTVINWRNCQQGGQVLAVGTDNF